MTAKPLRYSFRLCAGVLAAGAAMPEIAIAQTRSVPTNYSCYNVNAVAIDNWNTADLTAFSQATQNVGGQTLRVPGGDTANYWNWESTYIDGPNSTFDAGYGQDGGIVNWYDYIDNGAVVRRPGIFPFFLPQNLPDSLRYQNNTNATIENVETFVSGANADALWVMNMNTSYLEKELAHLERATTVGLVPTKIELGNELYFRGTFGSLEFPGFGSGDYARRDLGGNQRNQVAGFPNGEDIGGTIYGTPTDYAEAAKEWAEAVRTITPNAEIAITGVIPGTSTDPRITGWMSALGVDLEKDANGNSIPGTSALDAVDAITIHPYYSATDIGVTSSDIGNRARAGEIARAGTATFRSLMSDPAINTPNLANKKIWITEQNIIEPNDNVVVGNTWMGALMVDLHNHEALKDSRVDLSCTHVLTGNPQWQAIADEDGRVIDPNKRGTANSFTDGTTGSPNAQPFSQTANGFVLGKSAEVFEDGTATLLHSGPASVAWRIKDDAEGTDQISALNASDVDETFDLPSGEIWEVLTYIGDPWATIDGEDDLEVLLEILIGGSEVTIPAFSKLIATADPNAPRPRQPAGGDEDLEDGNATEQEGDTPAAGEGEIDAEAENLAPGPAPVNGSLEAALPSAEAVDSLPDGGGVSIEDVPDYILDTLRGDRSGADAGSPEEPLEPTEEPSPPADEPPADESPADEPEPPTEDSVEPPVVEPPVVGSPTVEPPVVEPSAEETPSVDSPVADSPVADNSPVEVPAEAGSDGNPQTSDTGDDSVVSPVIPPSFPVVDSASPAVDLPAPPITQTPQDAESIPEPSSVFGLGLASAGLLLLRRKRRSEKSDNQSSRPHFL